MKKNFAVSAIIALFSYLPLQVSAWGMLGHRIVGQIAEGHLSAKARKGVRSVLGTESLAMASNWADFIKSDTTYKYIDSWHYVNIPGGLDKQGVFNFLATDKEPNVYNKISDMIAILRDKKSTDKEKLMAMRLLVHFVGDVNQPMHTARKEDLGGNKVVVNWFGEKSNLHRIWDSSLIDHQQLSYSEYADAVNHPTKEQLKVLKSFTLQDYVYNSYEVCNKIYAQTKPDSRLSYNYNYDFLETLNDQLLKGGLCLANILNDIYK